MPSHALEAISSPRVISDNPVSARSNPRVTGQAARLAKVRQQGPLVLALFGAAVELRQGDHGDFEFLGEQLQRAENSDTSCCRFSTRREEEDISWR